MALGTPLYPVTLDTNATLGPTTSVTGSTPTASTGSGQGDLLGVVNNLIAQIIALQTKVGVTSSADTTSLDFRATLIKIGSVIMDFGTADNGGADSMTLTATVPALWITATSAPVVSIAGGLDHLDTDDSLLEEVETYCGNIVVGTSFDVVMYAPNGTWGRWQVNYLSNVT